MCPTLLEHILLPGSLLCTSFFVRFAHKSVCQGNKSVLITLYSISVRRYSGDLFSGRLLVCQELILSAAKEPESNGSNHCRIPTCQHFQIWIDTINTQLLAASGFVT